MAYNQDRKEGSIYLCINIPRSRHPRVGSVIGFPLNLSLFFPRKHVVPGCRFDLSEQKLGNIQKLE